MDPQNPMAAQYGLAMETLFGDDMTLDREEHSFTTAFKPSEVLSGWLAESWEMKDPLTYIVNLRHGVKWHEKSYMQAREFTAYDVEYSYEEGTADIILDNTL
jgi:ABC-type transport system substrate-binding protein